jgi:dolichol kinase
MSDTDAYPKYEILVSLVLCENLISHVRYSIKATGENLTNDRGQCKVGPRHMLDARSIARKVFHFSGASIPLCYLLAGKTAALIFAIALLVLSAMFEFLRIRGRLDISLVRKYIQVKDSETRKPTGSFFYLLAAPITILIFQESAAIASLFVVAIADPLSSLAGLQWGKTKILGKSLEGSAVFFIVSLLILSVFSFPVHVCFTAALVATLTELFTPKWLDDNLTIPLVTATVLTLLML